MGNSSISDKHVFFVALHFTTRVLKTKQRIDKKFPNKSQAEKDYLFTLVMGSFVYHEDTSIKNQMWLQTAGQLSDATGWKIEDASELLQKLGMDKKDVKKLRYEIRLQHIMSDGQQEDAMTMKETDNKNYQGAKNKYQKAYGSTSENFDKFWNKKLSAYTDNGRVTNADFAHQLITTATILRPHFSVADLNGGKNQLENLAGWLGDTTSKAEAAPSIKNDDYRARFR